MMNIKLKIKLILIIIVTVLLFYSYRENFLEYDISDLVRDREIENNGPAGPMGPRGPQGKDGPRGQTGRTGNRGPRGPRGSRGPRGYRGMQGPKGSRGYRGFKGADGRNGRDGTNGRNGRDARTISLSSNTQPVCVSGACLDKFAIEMMNARMGKVWNISPPNKIFRPMRSTMIPPSPISTSTNYRLSFDMKILGRVNGWSNIIHFTKHHNHGHYSMGWKARTPAIWLWNSSNMHIVTGNDRSANQHTADAGVRSLPMNRWMNFKIETTYNGKKVRVLKDNRLVSQFNLAGQHYGDNNIYVWMSDPWYHAANVELKNVKYERLPNSFQL